MKELIKKEYNYTLKIDDEKNYFLNVMCGGVALFELKFKLNQEEIESYLLSGEKAIDDLVKNVQKNTSQFLSRQI